MSDNFYEKQISRTISICKLDQQTFTGTTTHGMPLFETKHHVDDLAYHTRDLGKLLRNQTLYNKRTAVNKIILVKSFTMFYFPE